MRPMTVQPEPDFVSDRIAVLWFRHLALDVGLPSIIYSILNAFFELCLLKLLSGFDTKKYKNLKKFIVYGKTIIIYKDIVYGVIPWACHLRVHCFEYNPIDICLSILYI